MATTRQNKIARLLQKELGMYFQRNASLFLGKMISVTVVRTTPDLSVAKVYLSIFPTGEQESVLEVVNEQNKNIRYELSQITRHQLRKVPEFMFYIDDSLDYADRIDTLLK